MSTIETNYQTLRDVGVSSLPEVLKWMTESAHVKELEAIQAAKIAKPKAKKKKVVDEAETNL
jgi:hypothetical protein